MKKYILKIAAKEHFHQLKTKGSIWCGALNIDVNITQLFLKHIQYHKTRNLDEVEKRLLLIPFLTKVIKNGQCVETREKDKFNEFRIEKKHEKLNIACIVSYNKKSKKAYLLSIFLNTRKRSVLPSVGKSCFKHSDLSYLHATPDRKNSQDLCLHFKKFLKTQNLENQKILLMVSGGVDSMVLLDIASKIIDTKNIAVFHLDHNIRKNSKKDLEFVQKICSVKGVKFYSKKLNNNNKTKNLENQWRKARQEFSQKSAKDFGAKTILTAHHATDLVETMIFRLTKGCGISGLAPFDISTKPFWKIPKSEIITYAKNNKLKWKEDSSNLNTDFQRNLIRQNILPQLRKITPNLEKVFVKESIIFEEVQDFLDKQISINKNKISLNVFLSLHQIIQKEFLRKLSSKTPSFSEVKDCLKWLNNSPQGNSQKEIGDRQIKIQNGKITWK